MKNEQATEELKLIWAFINSLWLFIKTYQRTAYASEPDSYWDGLVRDAGALIEQYNRHPLCRKLTLAVVEYIRDEHRKEVGVA